MAKKSLVIGLAIIVLSLCCGVCFATDNGNNDGATNLGNQITQSLNKTGEATGNVVNGAGNAITGGVDYLDNRNGADNNTGDRDNFRSGVTNNTGFTNTANYNATRTAAAATTGTFAGMTTTTWMWIILAVVAVIIVAAVWYYATQNNSRD